MEKQMLNELEKRNNEELKNLVAREVKHQRRKKRKNWEVFFQEEERRKREHLEKVLADNERRLAEAEKRLVSRKHKVDLWRVFFTSRSISIIVRVENNDENRWRFFFRR